MRSRPGEAVRLVCRILAWPFIALILLYQRAVSPLLPPACRFTPTCSAYGLEALRRYQLRGLLLLGHRLLRCHPFCEGGEDPVP